MIFVEKKDIVEKKNFFSKKGYCTTTYVLSSRCPSTHAYGITFSNIHRKNKKNSEQSKKKVEYYCFLLLKKQKRYSNDFVTVEYSNLKLLNNELSHLVLHTCLQDWTVFLNSLPSFLQTR